jgi:hypothetical protein
MLDSELRIFGFSLNGPLPRAVLAHRRAARSASWRGEAASRGGGAVLVVFCRYPFPERKRPDLTGHRHSLLRDRWIPVGLSPRRTAKMHRVAAVAHWADDREAL